MQTSAITKPTTSATINVNTETKPENQTDNKLLDLSLTGTKDTPPAAFLTLAFINRLPPDIKITPKSISIELKKIADRNGSKKFKKSETIRAEFLKLIKAGYMTRELNRDSKGASMETQYFINYDKIRGVENSTDNYNYAKIYGGGVENSTDDKALEIKQKYGGGVENSTDDYIRNARGVSRNTNTTKLCVSVKQKNPQRLRRDFFAAVPGELRNKDTWILINSLIKYFEDDAFDFMTKVFANETIEHDKKIAYLWGAIRKRKSDTAKSKSLFKETSNENKPSNPQKSDTNKESYAQAMDDLDAKFEKCVAKLSVQDKIELIKNIIPKLNKFVVKRLGLNFEICDNLIEYYLKNPSIRHEIIEYYELF